MFFGVLYIITGVENHVYVLYLGNLQIFATAINIHPTTVVGRGLSARNDA